MARSSHNSVGHKNMLKQEGELLSRTAELVQEGYPFHEALLILLPHHTDQLHSARNIANETFRNGKGPAEVLEALGIENRHLLPIELAEEHGRLAQAVKAVAQQLKRKQKMLVKIKKLLAYPIVLFSFMGILFVVFRSVFLPNLKMLADSRSQETGENITNLPDLLLKLPDFLLIILLTVMLAVFLFWISLRKKSQKKKQQFVLKVPVLSHLYRMLLTISFAGEIGNMLHTGMSLQDSLDVLQNQNRHPSLKLVAMEVRKRIIEGESLSASIRNEAFMTDFPAFVEHGEIGGHLGKELLIYSNLMDSKLEDMAMRALGFLQPVLFSILAICILSAYLAILLPMYDLLNTI